MSQVRPLEIESKYRIGATAEVAALLRRDALGEFRAIDPERTIQLEDRYVDTADGAISRAGFAARLRHAPAGTVITVKSLSGGTGGALHRREELEGPADRARQPHDWPASAARSLVLELAGDGPLVELVTVRQLRRSRRFRGPDGALELSLDEVDVVSRGRIVGHFDELEIELIDGPESQLEAVAAIIGGVVALSPSPESKLAQALAAVGNGSGGAPKRRPAIVAAGEAVHGQLGVRADPADSERRGDPGEGRGSGASPKRRPAASPELESTSPPDPAMESQPEPGAASQPEPVAGPPPLLVGKSPGVLAEDTLAEAGRKVLRFHLARMLAREPGTRSGKDPEDLHGMRVATRRMRSAWRVFGDAYRQGRTRRYRRDLRSVAARLGAVRDLDVLIEGLVAYADKQRPPERAALGPLLDAWRARRDEARLLLLRTLDADAYARFVEEYREFVRADGTAVRPTTPTTPHRVRDAMPSRIWSAYESVRAYEAILRWADVETLHELRIAAKRLRYTLEFVREPLGPDAGPLIARVVGLQDHLGLLHDADVAAGLARQFLVDRSGDLSEPETAAIGRYLMDRERELARLRRTVGGAWRRVAGLGFRRSLGRVVAGL